MTDASTTLGRCRQLQAVHLLSCLTESIGSIPEAVNTPHRRTDPPLCFPMFGPLSHATRSRLLLNIQANSLFRGHPHSRYQHAQRPRGSPLLSNHFSNIRRIDGNAQRRSIIDGHALHVHTFWAIDHELDQGRDGIGNVLWLFHD
jgi:hypothetical protein